MSQVAVRTAGDKVGTEGEDEDESGDATPSDAR